MNVKAEYIAKADLSAEATAALLSCGTNRQGKTPAPSTPAAILEELRALGYLGKTNGLTRRGTIKRQILVEDQFNALFN